MALATVSQQVLVALLFLLASLDVLTKERLRTIY